MVNRWLTAADRPPIAAPRGCNNPSEFRCQRVTKRVKSWHGINRLRYIKQRGAEPMDDEQLADLHKFLADHHRRLAKEAVLDVVQHYHADLAQRLADEAALISRRTAIAQRLREGEQRKREELE